MAAPVPLQATVDGATLVITFDQNLDPSSVPSQTQFDVEVNGSPDVVTTVTLPGDPTCVLTLTTAVAFGDSVTVAYTEA